MVDQIRPCGARFEQTTPTTELPTSQLLEAILQVSEVSIQLARTERKPRYDDTGRENDAEHSLMNVLLAIPIVEKLKQDYPDELEDITVGEVCMLLACHELVEIIRGDVQTFTISDAEYAKKEQGEQDAVEEICRLVPESIARLIRRYQTRAEGDLACSIAGMIDKISPYTVDVLRPHSMSRVMHEDYGVKVHADLQVANNCLEERYMSRYPEKPIEPLHIAMRSLAEQFEQKFIPSEVIAEEAALYI